MGEGLKRAKQVALATRQRTDDPLSRLCREHTEFRDERDLLRKRTELLERRLMQEVDTKKLKALWDSYDGAETSDWLISGEMVHAELNKRGLGSYCAV